MPRIVLAYSGGLDTSVAIPWLSEKYKADIVAVTMDLGQGKELDDIRERALAIGAVRAHVIDAREEFAQDFILPALQAGALYEGRYPLATALGRPLIAKHLVEVARIEGATAVAHGCTGKGNDQVRMDVSVRALEPGMRVIAPARMRGLSRPDAIEYARARGIPVPATAGSPYSTDVNMWGRSIACGVLEDPWVEPPDDIFQLTSPVSACPNRPAYVELAFEKGVPITLNGVPMPLVELIVTLETIAGTHGIGRIDMVENRLVGIKSREVYEAPAAVVLHTAHRELQQFVSPPELSRLSADLGGTYAALVYNGLWYSPARQAIDAFARTIQDRVTGVIRLKLFKGNCSVVGRRSPNALYDYAMSTYGNDDAFDHAAADGFVKLWGLPLEIAARQAKQKASGPAKK